MTRHYATVCPPGQLGVLLRSMERHCGRFVLHALAWDWPPAWPGTSTCGSASLHVDTREAFLARHPEFAPDRLPGRRRTPNELACTVRWPFALDVLLSTGQPVTLIDGDLWFWSSPEPVYAEIGDARCAVSPHGFAPASEGLLGVTLESHRKYGAFNGGFSYWADPAPLRWMAEANRRWSYAAIEHFDGRERFGDQSWLEEVERHFGAHVIRHPGLNVGPWNVHRYPLPNYDGPQDLIAYHYSSLRFDGLRVTQLADRPYAVTQAQAERFYAPYVRELERASSRPSNS